MSGMKTEESEFSEDERQLLVLLATEAYVRIKDDPSFYKTTNEMEVLLRKLFKMKVKIDHSL